MAKIIVTGAAGFIGSHTVDALLADGHRVWGVDDFSTGKEGNVVSARNNGLDLRRISVLDRARFHGLLREVRPEVIIHFAGLVSVIGGERQPDLNFSLNVAATHQLAEAARAYGIRRIVFASSAAIYGEAGCAKPGRIADWQPISAYGLSKLLSEKLLRYYAQAYGIEIRVQRYFNVYGPRQPANSPYSGLISILVNRFCQHRAIVIHGDGKQTRDFIHVKDVARSNVLAAVRPTDGIGVVDICTGRTTSVNEVVKMLAQLGPLAPRRRKPARPGDIRHSQGSPAAASRELGFQARISLKAGLQELVALATTGGRQRTGRAKVEC